MFIEAPLAGAVGQGKEEVGVERLGGLEVAGELPVIAGHGQDQGREGPQRVLHRVTHQGSGLPTHCLSKQVLRLAFHDCDSGSFMGLADDRVGLPVPAALLRVDNCGALADVATARDAAAAGAAPGGLAAARLVALPQGGVQ